MDVMGGGIVEDVGSFAFAREGAANGSDNGGQRWG